MQSQRKARYHSIIAKDANIGMISPGRVVMAIASIGQILLIVGVSIRRRKMKDCKCSICGKVWGHGFWNNRYYLETSEKIETLEATEENLVCDECADRIIKESEFVFVQTPPSEGVLGITLAIIKHDSEEELIKRLKNLARGIGICCMDDDMKTICVVCTDERTAFRIGYVKPNCIRKGKLPDFIEEFNKRYPLV